MGKKVIAVIALCIALGATSASAQEAVVVSGRGEGPGVSIPTGLPARLPVEETPGEVLGTQARRGEVGSAGEGAVLGVQARQLPLVLPKTGGLEPTLAVLFGVVAAAAGLRLRGRG